MPSMPRTVLEGGSQVQVDYALMVIATSNLNQIRVERPRENLGFFLVSKPILGRRSLTTSTASSSEMLCCSPVLKF